MVFGQLPGNTLHLQAVNDIKPMSDCPLKPDKIGFFTQRHVLVPKISKSRLGEQ